MTGARAVGHVLRVLRHPCGADHFPAIRRCTRKPERCTERRVWRLYSLALPRDLLLSFLSSSAAASDCGLIAGRRAADAGSAGAALTGAAAGACVRGTGGFTCSGAADGGMACGRSGLVRSAGASLAGRSSRRMVGRLDGSAPGPSAAGPDVRAGAVRSGGAGTSLGGDTTGGATGGRVGLCVCVVGPAGGAGCVMGVAGRTGSTTGADARRGASKAGGAGCGATGGAT